MNKFFITGYYERWGAKHHQTDYLGYISPEDAEKLGARKICECHCPCVGEMLGGPPRFEYELWVVDVPEEQTTIQVAPTKYGIEGYDVALCDPWDANPRDHYEKPTLTTELEVSPTLPEPCIRCPHAFNFAQKCVCKQVFEVYEEEK